MILKFSESHGSLASAFFSCSRCFTSNLRLGCQAKSAACDCDYRLPQIFRSSQRRRLYVFIYPGLRTSLDMYWPSSSTANLSQKSCRPRLLPTKKRSGPRFQLLRAISMSAKHPAPQVTSSEKDQISFQCTTGPYLYPPSGPMLLAARPSAAQGPDAGSSNHGHPHTHTHRDNIHITRWHLPLAGE